MTWADVSLIINKLHRCQATLILENLFIENYIKRDVYLSKNSSSVQYISVNLLIKIYIYLVGFHSIVFIFFFVSILSTIVYSTHFKKIK
jgi:hypothetical protein